MIENNGCVYFKESNIKLDDFYTRITFHTQIVIQDRSTTKENFVTSYPQCMIN